jgi:hypothetical protein
MQEWPTDEEESAQEPRTPLPRRWTLRDPQVRDNAFVTVLALFYAILAGFPLYNLVTGNGSRPQDFSILGGMVGLIIAGFAAMDIPVHWALRLMLAAVGIGFIVGFWGFGPM